MTKDSTRLLAVAATAAAAALTGCGVYMSDVDAVSDPLTPDESRAQVVDAAAEIVTTLNLPVLRTAFWRASCNDAGLPPFRGHVRITYPRADTYARSENEIAKMIELLEAQGWADNPGFHSHSRATAKNKVTAIFQNQNASVVDRAIDVIGECRDITTASQLDDDSEWFTLP
jgi:hypothetical protein